MLLCIIAHLFVIKLRMEFNCKPQSPVPAPYIDEPVSLDEYLEAAEDLASIKDILHPNISAIPGKPQQVMTIGLIRMLIEASFQKVGSLLKDLDYYLYKAAQAFDSHSRTAVRKAFAYYYGIAFDSG